MAIKTVILRAIINGEIKAMQEFLEGLSRADKAHNELNKSTLNFDRLELNTIAIVTADKLGPLYNMGEEVQLDTGALVIKLSDTLVCCVAGMYNKAGIRADKDSSNELSGIFNMAKNKTTGRIKIMKD